MTEKNIEVFQDLHLRTRSASVSIRNLILGQICSPWHHDAEREKEVKDYAHDSEDVIVLVRESFNDIEESGLLLWQENDGYRVANIVPRKAGELGIAKYNTILQDFVSRVAEPAANQGDFKVDMTSPRQTLEDWLEAAPAASLRRFSSLANKSTGASHPRDQERWYEFLIEAHRASANLDSERLARWLIEVEGWSSEAASELARDYEVARDLLQKYDHYRT